MPRFVQVPAWLRFPLCAVMAGAFALASALAPCARAQGQVPDGDWISAPFADALVARRSPVAAAEASPPIGLSIRTEGGVTRLAVTSFHETMHWKLVGQELRQGGSARLVLAQEEADPGPGAPRQTFDYTLRDDHGATTLTTTLTFAGEGTATYRRVSGTIDAWTAEVMLAGAYRDERGRPWRFGLDQWARTPEGAYRYSVALDPSEAGCSYFETPDPSQPGEKRRVGFAWNGTALHLFRIVYEPDRAPIDCASKPFAVLHREEPSARRPKPGTGGPAATAACLLSPLAIGPQAGSDWSHVVSKATNFTLRHQNPGGAPRPQVYTEPITLVRRDGTTCEFDPTNYQKMWVSGDEGTIAVVASSGSSSDLLLFDARTCALRDRVGVFGDGVTVDGDVVRHPGECEMADRARGSCVPASFWRLDATCRPVRLEEESLAWTRERFGVAFAKPSEIERPSLPGARWLGLTRND
jgi:hypothetical protein